ncbi:hypothetical protein LINGRAHAP2_LOCUS10467 [Linum grandiflorum]
MTVAVLVSLEGCFGHCRNRCTPSIMTWHGNGNSGRVIFKFLRQDMDWSNFSLPRRRLRIRF